MNSDSSPSAEGGRALDEAVILRAQQGDPEAFAGLVRGYEGSAFRAAYLIVRDEAEARDVAQEAFLRAYRSLGRFDARRAFRPWLLRIVTNLALNSARRAARQRARDERYERTAGVQGTAASAEETVEAQERGRRVWQAMSALTPDDQTVLYLRYFLAASEEDTALTIGRPVGTVKSRVHRALRRLQTVIKQQYPDLLPEAATRPVGVERGR